MIRGTCTQRGIVFDNKNLVDVCGAAGVREIKSRLTIKKTKRMGQRYNHRESKLYMEVQDGRKKLFVISRFSLNVVRDVVKKRGKKWTLVNKIPMGEDIPADRLEPGPKFYPNQQVISDYLDQNVYKPSRIRTGTASTVVVMGTGEGKTYLGVGKIKHFAKKTLIIVPSKAVMVEWVKALADCLPKARVGNYLKKTDGDVVLMVINTACKDIISVKQPTSNGRLKLTKLNYFDYFKRFGFVIFDEIHNYTSPVKQTALWRTNFARTMGLTATPDEDSWGMDIVFEKHVGALTDVTKIPGFNTSEVEWKGSYNAILYKGPADHTEVLVNPGNGWTSHGNMVTQFSRDPYRTIAGLHQLRQLYKRGRNTFIFFKNRDIADALQPLILKYATPGAVASELNPQSTILMGGATDKDNDDAKKSSFVLTTFGYGWQGVSIPKMDTLFFWTPRVAKMKQIIGRILRKSGDPTILREIYDLIDQNTKLGKDEYRDRKRIISEIIDFDKTDPLVVEHDQVLEYDWMSVSDFEYIKKVLLDTIKDPKAPSATVDKYEDDIEEIDDCFLDI